MHIQLFKISGNCRIFLIEYELAVLDLFPIMELNFHKKMVVVSRKFTYLPSLIKSTHSPVKGLLVYLDTHDPQGDFFQLTSYNSNLNYFQNILQNIIEIFPSFSRDFATTHKMERYSFDLILLFQKG